MLYHIQTAERTAGGRHGLVYTLRHAHSAAAAEVWPEHGFNCLRWSVGRDPARAGEILYADPNWEQNPVPTRSGVPLLFPFPNRIRDGRFTFEGREYRLPLNDSAKRNAIHGFAPRHRWRVTDQGTGPGEAWLRGEFRASLDAPETLELWPADYTLEATIRLSLNRLRYDFRVTNPGDGPLPFGLGMHPYLRFPHAGPGADVSRYRLLAPARSIWALEESLPTGERQPAAGPLDWNTMRALKDTALDTLYTDLGVVTTPAAGLYPRAELRHAEFGGAVQVWASPDFRESVLFTPVHRQAVCIEPYTCATDAANLAQRGVDAGWRVLPPGREWKAVVEFRWDPDATEVLRVPEPPGPTR